MSPVVNRSPYRIHDGRNHSLYDLEYLSGDHEIATDRADLTLCAAQEVVPVNSVHIVKLQCSHFVKDCVADPMTHLKKGFAQAPEKPMI
jgi:hypothetical protein